MRTWLFSGVLLSLLLLFSLVGCDGSETNNGSAPTDGDTGQPIVVKDVYITHICFDGQVPTSEADEYVEIANVGDKPQNLTGCVLMDIEETYQRFVFPYCILQPGESVRVYTNEEHPGCFSFGRGQPIWNNEDPDTAVLYDSYGNELSRMSY